MRSHDAYSRLHRRAVQAFPPLGRSLALSGTRSLLTGNAGQASREGRFSHSRFLRTRYIAWRGGGSSSEACVLLCAPSLSAVAGA